MHQQKCRSNRSAATTPVQQDEGNKTRAARRGQQQEECSIRESGATTFFYPSSTLLLPFFYLSSTFRDRQRLRGEEEWRGKRREGETWRGGRQEWKREAMWLLSSTCCLPRSVCVCERESAQRAACPHLAHDLAHALPLECFSVSWRCT